MELNKVEIERWFQDRGDYTHNITHNLNEESVVMDLGGFTGLWAKQILDKYNPNIYIIEPIKTFYEQMINKFEIYNNVHLMNVAIGVENKEGEIFLNGDSTSTNKKNGDPVSVSFKTMETLLKHWGIDTVDLVQINIEGDEYIILESLLDNGLINKFRNIQVQFHYGVEGDIERRINIRKGLIENGFKEKFNYPFVWESWSKE